MISADGGKFAVTGEFCDASGMLGVHSSKGRARYNAGPMPGYDPQVLLAAFRATRESAGPIGISFFQARLTIPPDSAQQAVGAALEWCR
ncbi:hypothetical protein [Pelagibacterium montanilacus]|uniref:hypothetical protein n=1 Tax=Pelagibacterium montanilacus TaxID=2185280 RepID=UPI000F8DDD7A|nr:hypothetical protein [Pelagibacterium montanilacus]